MTEQLKVRCKAKSKQTGEQCRNWAKPGYPVCRFHGAGGRPALAVQQQPQAVGVGDAVVPRHSQQVAHRHGADAAAHVGREPVAALGTIGAHGIL